MLRRLRLLALCIVFAAPALAQDAREPAVRTEAERHFILGQMRLFLQAAQAIVSALSTEDRQAVAAEASARGRNFPERPSLPLSLKEKETAAWAAMMGRTRNGFDALAAAARDGAAPARMMGLLGETMQNCVACHQSYRLAGE